jgi:nucleotide-binding universal stress UspA family protein
MTADTASAPVILCWDGSSEAEHAINAAAALFGRHRTGVVLLAYVPTEERRGLLAGWSGPDAPPMSPPDAEEMLARGVEAATTTGITAEGVLVAAEQKTAEVIARVADERDAAVVVMGQGNRSAVGRMVLGSVAREVLSGQHRPVLLIGPGGAISGG